MSPPVLPVPQEAILFDLDGTLIDSREDLAGAVNLLLQEIGLPSLAMEVVVPFIGRGARHLVTQAVLAGGGGSVSSIPEEWIQRWMLLYGDRCLEKTRAYPGAMNALTSLHSRGIPLAVVTNKPQDLADHILDGLGMSPLLASVLGGDRVSHRKPSPIPLWMTASRLGTSPHRMVMVGDSEVDVHAGREAGMGTLGCLWGIGNPERLRASSPLALAETWEEALGVLTGVPFLGQ